MGYLTCCDLMWHLQKLSILRWDYQMRDMGARGWSLLLVHMAVAWTH